MQMQFYLLVEGQHTGPFSYNEVIDKLGQRSLRWSHLVYDDSSKDWILIFEHPQFTEAFNSGWGRQNANPIRVETSHSQKSSKSPHREKVWYVMHDENNYGPYSYLEVIQMLQEKALFDFDFVWKEGRQSWKRIADVQDFSPESIRELKESGEEGVNEVFFRRRHARAEYGCQLIVHDNKSVYKGHSVEISAGGAGIVISSHVLQPGQTVFLHFQTGEGVPPFNAICCVVSKNYAKADVQPESHVKYGVKFTSISRNIRESIKTYAEARLETVKAAA